MTEPTQTTRPDGLHCVYKSCRMLEFGVCNPGCSFQGSAVDPVELLSRHLPVPLPLAREALPRELVKEIAMEIGKEAASHVEMMYPKAVEATSRNMLLSLRNSIHNDIMAAVDALECGDGETWLMSRQANRRTLRAQWRKATRDADILDGAAIYE